MQKICRFKQIKLPPQPQDKVGTGHRRRILRRLFLFYSSLLIPIRLLKALRSATLFFLFPLASVLCFGNIAQADGFVFPRPPDIPLKSLAERDGASRAKSQQAFMCALSEEYQKITSVGLDAYHKKVCSPTLTGKKQ
jgi:hypothetical protein